MLRKSTELRVKRVKDQKSSISIKRSTRNMKNETESQGSTVKLLKKDFESGDSVKNEMTETGGIHCFKKRIGITRNPLE